MPAEALCLPALADDAAEALGDEIATLCSCLYAAEARLLAMLRRFDAERCFEALGFQSTAHWLNYRCGVGMNAAREKVRVAKALPELPMIREAFAAGRLSYSKVRAITRVAKPDNEAYLLTFAEHGTAHHVEKLVSRTRKASRLQEEVAAEAIHANRSLSIRYDQSGAMIFEGRLPAEQGALVLKALEMAMDEAFFASRQEASDDSGDVTAETSARRADALIAVAETFLAHPAHSGSTADRYQVVVHVTAETSGNDSIADQSHLEDGPRITAETSRRLSCDCNVVPIRENAFGEPLAIGRRSRSIPPAISRALRVRDGGCRFPGCTHSRFVDGHHIEHWAEGGETSLDNLVLLCRHHHRLVHEGGFGCRRDDSGEIVFSDRQSRPVSQISPLPGFAGDLDDYLDRYVFEQDIDHESCKAKMDASDRIDWALALGHCRTLEPAGDFAAIVYWCAPASAALIRARLSGGQRSANR